MPLGRRAHTGHWLCRAELPLSSFQDCGDGGMYLLSTNTKQIVPESQLSTIAHLTVFVRQEAGVVLAMSGAWSLWQERQWLGLQCDALTG